MKPQIDVLTRFSVLSMLTRQKFLGKRLKKKRIDLRDKENFLSCAIRAGNILKIRTMTGL